MPYYNRDPKRDHNFDNHPDGTRRIERWNLCSARLKTGSPSLSGGRGSADRASAKRKLESLRAFLWVLGFWCVSFGFRVLGRFFWC